MTQGRTKKDALLMIKDAVELVFEVGNFKVNVESIDNNQFSLSTNNDSVLLGLLIKS